jgi:hypothetical protein
MAVVRRDVRGYPTGLLPWMIRSTTAPIAMTRSKWMNPPSVKALTMPSIHRIRRSTKIDMSIAVPLQSGRGYTEVAINSRAKNRQGAA